MTPIVEVEILPPLMHCFLQCETECMRECCGIDAISTDPDLIAYWARRAGPATTSETILQLDNLIELVEKPSHKFISRFLNHFTNDDVARQQLLDFFNAFRIALEAVAHSS